MTGGMVAAEVERLARHGRARLLAFLVRQGRDLAAAEDALSDAYARALECWPAQGVPDKPEAWLLVVARRRLIDGRRVAATQARMAESLLPLVEEAHELAAHAGEFPDDRLRLMFVCTHPAIAPTLHAPLMLQVVLGIDAARIASCLLVKPATMGQRLSRAKTKLRDDGVGFEVPAATELSARLPAVLDAIYAAFTLGWDREPRVGAAAGRGLAAEAVELGRLLAGWLPTEPEALGLLALMLHSHSRAEASRRDGFYVPLSEQDTGLWRADRMDEADAVLARAARLGKPGRFQLESAIQATHNQRRHGPVDWGLVVTLYDGLMALAPSLGARLGHAAALAEARSPALAWQELARLDEAEMAEHQPYWALRADLARRLGWHDHARQAYERAMGLCVDPAARSFLAGRMAECAGSAPSGMS